MFSYKTQVKYIIFHSFPVTLQLSFRLYCYSMSGGRKPAKRAQKLPEIRLAQPRPSEAGPSARNVSWTTTIKCNEDKGHIKITESKRTRDSHRHYIHVSI